MTATTTDPVCGEHATDRVVLREDVFDQRCEELGATTEVARAELIDSDRGTLHRIRRQQINPTAKLVMRWALRLGVQVEDLWRFQP